jgi:hypothetical protein
VNVDHTAKSGPQRVRDLLREEAEELLSGRVQVINLWRPIRGPLRDSPLAVCDASSVAPEDLVPADLVYANRIGETYAVTYNPSHRWIFVPEMKKNEALLIKCFDSLTDGRARFAPHTAFDDPTAPPNVLPRESIESHSSPRDSSSVLHVLTQAGALRSVKKWPCSPPRTWPNVVFVLNRVSQRLRASLGVLFGSTLLVGSSINALAELPRGGLRLAGDTGSAGTNPYGSATVYVRVAARATEREDVVARVRELQQRYGFSWNGSVCQAEAGHPSGFDDFTIRIALGCGLIKPEP